MTKKRHSPTTAAPTVVKKEEEDDDKAIIILSPKLQAVIDEIERLFGELYARGEESSSGTPGGPSKTAPLVQKSTILPSVGDQMMPTQVRGTSTRTRRLFRFDQGSQQLSTLDTVPLSGAMMAFGKGGHWGRGSK